MWDRTSEHRTVLLITFTQNSFYQVSSWSLFAAVINDVIAAGGMNSLLPERAALEMLFISGLCKITMKTTLGSADNACMVNFRQRKLIYF